MSRSLKENKYIEWNKHKDTHIKLSGMHLKQCWVGNLYTKYLIRKMSKIINLKSTHTHKLKKQEQNKP